MEYKRSLWKKIDLFFHVGIAVTASMLCSHNTKADSLESIALEGFETPSFAPKGFKYFPTGSVWTFNGRTGSGIQHNDSGWTVVNAHEGQQTAFLQGADAHISTVVRLSPGIYTISFYAAQRPYGKDAPNSIQVKVNGIHIGQPFKLSSTAFTRYNTSSFPLSSTGYYKVEFVQIEWHGDSLLDAVSMNRIGPPMKTDIDDNISATGAPILQQILVNVFSKPD